MDITHKDFESYALIKYAESLPDGHILKDIAIRTLCDLKRGVIYAYNSKPVVKYNKIFFLKKAPRSKKVVHILSGLVFSCIREASLNLRIQYSALRRDMYAERYNFNVYYYEKTTINQTKRAIRNRGVS